MNGSRNLLVELFVAELPKAAHYFNLLLARDAISVAERAPCTGCIPNLAQSDCTASRQWVDQMPKKAA
ncbi:MAG: hypothetical protein ABIQ90_07190 [Polaromonas sp.]